MGFWKAPRDNLDCNRGYVNKDRLTEWNYESRGMKKGNPSSNWYIFQKMVLNVLWVGCSPGCHWPCCVEKSRPCSKERFIQIRCASYDFQAKEIPSGTCRLKSFRSPKDLMDWKRYLKIFWHSSGRKPMTWAPARVKGQGPNGYLPLSLQRFI